MRRNAAGVTVASTQRIFGKQVRQRPPRRRKVRPVRASAGLQAQYRHILSGYTGTMIEATQTGLEAVLDANFIDAAPAIRDGVNSDFEHLMQTLRDRFIVSGELAQDAAARFVQSGNDTHKERFYNSMNSAFGVDMRVLVNEAGLEDTLLGAVNNNVSLIKSIPEEYFNKIERMVYQNVAVQADKTSMIDQLINIGDVSENRARVIARDQTSKLNSTLNQVRQKAIGVEEYRWLTVGDGDRVRPTHRANNGKIFRWDTPPKVTGHPGHDVQCIPGDASVQLFSGVNKLFRRLYTGELTQLITDSGAALRSTPNHPCLTQRGWVAAESVEVGDKLVYACKQSLNGVETDDKQVITFQDLFATFNQVLGIESTEGFSSQFHGDGMIDQHVDIIDLKSKLGSALKPGTLKTLEEFVFAWTEKYTAGFLPMFGGSNFGSLANHGPSTGGIGVLSELLSTLTVKLRYAVEHSATSVSDGNAFSDEHVGKSAPVASNVLRQLLDAIAAEIPIDDVFFVELDRIVCWSVMAWYREPALAQFNAEIIGADPQGFCNVLENMPRVEQRFSAVEKVGRELFSGHVYNLETENNFYTSSHYTFSNCRCLAQPIIVL